MLDRALDVESQRRAGHSGCVPVEPTDAAAQDGSLNQDRSDTQQEKFYSHCQLHKYDQNNA